MKKYIKIAALSVMVTLFSVGFNTVHAQWGNDNDDYYDNYNGYDNGYNNDYDDDYDDNYNNNNYQSQIGFNDFYQQLAPYGRWVYDPMYGRVWIANVPNFQPYATNGYWAYTNYGWTWVSNYRWGWAPFHYGRWGHSRHNGWFWVPGYTWSPAWVNWSRGADVYGWAPLGPGMSIGINISIGSIPINFWTFMPSRYMGYRNIHSHYYDHHRNTVLIRNTTIINNYGNVRNHRYARGPLVRDVERHTSRRITPMRVVNSSSNRNTGVRNNQLRVYRPAVRGTASSPNVNRGNTNINRRSEPSRNVNRSRVESNRNRVNPPRTINRSRTQSSSERVITPPRRERSSSPARVQTERSSTQRSVPQRSSSSYHPTQRRVQRTSTTRKVAPVQRTSSSRQSTRPATRSRVSVPSRSESRGAARSSTHTERRSVERGRR